MDMLESIAPRSDQLNAEDLLSGPRTITITDVTRGTAEQPVDMVNAEFPGRPYKPSKTMRRMIVAAWGTDTSAYIGRRITIYRDPDITFGKDKVGGIRISHLSHLDKRLQIALTVTRGKRATFTVDPLADEPAATTAPPTPAAELNELFGKAGLPKDRRDERIVVVRHFVGRDVASAGELTDGELTGVIAVLGELDREGNLVDQVADILDMAALESEAAK